MFKQLDVFLDEIQPYDNYWSTMGIDDAVGLLEKFPATAWAALAEAIADRPERWQVCCAEALGEVPPSEGAQRALVTLLKTAQSVAREAALESCQGWLQDDWAMPSTMAGVVREAIAALRPAADAVLSTKLDELAAQLDAREGRP